MTNKTKSYLAGYGIVTILVSIVLLASFYPAVAIGIVIFIVLGALGLLISTEIYNELGRD
jgi:hypothetical protein